MKTEIEIASCKLKWIHILDNPIRFQTVHNVDFYKIDFTVIIKAMLQPGNSQMWKVIAYFEQLPKSNNKGFEGRICSEI